MALILVIDDDYAQRAFYKHHLELAGPYGVLYWPRGRGGPKEEDIAELRDGDIITDIAKVRTQDIDVVFLDYRLHTIDPGDVVDAFRDTANPLMFLITGFPEPAVHQFCAAYGLYYLDKQEIIEHPEQVLRTVTALLKNESPQNASSMTP